MLSKSGYETFLCGDGTHMTNTYSLKEMKKYLTDGKKAKAESKNMEEYKSKSKRRNENENDKN